MDNQTKKQRNQRSDNTMFRNKTSRQHNFATVPRQDVARSKYPIRQTRKMAFNASELVPIMCEEVLPGDTWQHTESVLARLATPIAPVIDDMDLETFYFFVPNRITWPDWEDFITGTDDTLTIPTVVPYDGTNYSVTVGRIFDHFGLPAITFANEVTFNILPLWAYLTIWNEWFRDQNLQLPWTWSPTWTSGGNQLIGQGATGYYQECLRVNKRHDYFTSSLPWPQKGDAVAFPLGSTASLIPAFSGAGPSFVIPGNLGDFNLAGTTATDATTWDNVVGTGGTVQWNPAVNGSGLIVDLATGVAPTLNAIRAASVTQKILELDARGGSRYVEQILSHFGVRSPDYRLQRPEYLGGSRIPVTVNPIAQTAAYDAEPAAESSAIGNLGAEMHASGHRRTFTYAATEHGYIIGLAVLRTTPTYQQGVRRHWLRQTRLDFWFPSMNGLGEQAVQTREIYQTTTNTYANETWGYQERAAEYRYMPNEITGHLRSTAPEPLDWWHYSEELASEPALNAAFITDKTQETLARSLATAPSEQWSSQIIMDIVHGGSLARLMPAYGVPGIDRF